MNTPEYDRIELDASDLLVRTLLALEIAYQFKEHMPEEVQSLIKNRIDEARIVL